VLVVLGLLDQTSPALVPNYQTMKDVTQTQKAFGAQLQAALPEGSMIFQLPYVAFPGAGRTMPNGVGDYDHLVPYIYSDGLKWSFGAMNGRETAAWQSKTATLPAPQMVQELKDTGFAAIYVDQVAYADNGKQIVTDLAKVLGPPDVQSSDGQVLLWRLNK